MSCSTAAAAPPSRSSVSATPRLPRTEAQRRASRGRRPPPSPRRTVTRRGVFFVDARRALEEPVDDQRRGRFDRELSPARPSARSRTSSPSGAIAKRCAGGCGSVLKLARDDDPQRSQRTDVEFAHVVAGHVLDDHAAGAARALPSVSATVEPISRSRSWPYVARRGPAQPAASVPPTVARRGSGASNGMNWPCSASVPATLSSVMPASKPIVRSRGS